MSFTSPEPSPELCAVEKRRGRPPSSYFLVRKLGVDLIYHQTSVIIWIAAADEWCHLSPKTIFLCFTWYYRKPAVFPWYIKFQRSIFSMRTWKHLLFSWRNKLFAFEIKSWNSCKSHTMLKFYFLSFQRPQYGNKEDKYSPVCSCSRLHDLQHLP